MSSFDDDNNKVIWFGDDDFDYAAAWRLLLIKKGRISFMSKNTFLFYRYRIIRKFETKKKPFLSYNIWCDQFSWIMPANSIVRVFFHFVMLGNFQPMWLTIFSTNTFIHLRDDNNEWMEHTSINNNECCLPFILSSNIINNERNLTIIRCTWRGTFEISINAIFIDCGRERNFM